MIGVATFTKACCKPEDGRQKEEQKQDADRQGKDQHLGQQVDFDFGLVFGTNLHKLASDVGDLFGLLVNGQGAVPVHIEQVLTDQVLVVDERWAADHLVTLFNATARFSGRTSFLSRIQFIRPFTAFDCFAVLPPSVMGFCCLFACFSPR